MKIDIQAMVRRYHKVAGITIGEEFDLQHKDLGLRDSLVEEEASEVLNASTPEQILKELADLVYVCFGYAVTYGWDLNEAIDRIHKNNVGRMKQPDGTIKYREDGKVLKNPHYPKVDLSDLV